MLDLFLGRFSNDFLNDFYVYFHSSELGFFEDSKLRMVIILALDHLGHFLELLLILLWLIGPDAWIINEVPKRDSSISVLLATYLVLRDLLLIDS